MAKKLWIWLLFVVLSGCSHLFYHPDPYMHFPPEQFGFKYEVIPFKAADGVDLLGWYFAAPGASPKGTLIQFHGNAENMTSHYQSMVWVVNEGYSLFVFDYRGYGLSKGEPDQDGTYLDALAGLQKAYELAQGKGVFVVVGQSLGGAIAMNAIPDFKEKKAIDLIVLDSTFYSYDAVAQAFLASHWLTWIFSPLGPLLVSDKRSAEDALKTNSTRLLYLHDHKDPVVPYSCGEKSYALATGPKEFWEQNEGFHVGAFQEQYPHNRERFLKVLAELSPKNK